MPVTVELDAPSGFATGLRRGPHGYALESHELPVATYTAFGAREVRSLEAAGIAFRLALLDGRLDLGPERVAHWLETSLAAVTRFYREPPDEQILVIVAPLPDRRGVRFGKLLPESAPGIVILVGEHTTPADLTEDWMLVHELFHVGTPSFDHEGDWLDEGLATYFEPLIRARAGFTDEKTVWREMASEMPRGLHALTEIGLLHGTTRNDLYWGGGLFCLLADVEARRRTGGERGLEDGLRAVLRAGGRSSEVWGLDTMVETLDLGIGSPVVHELYEKYAKRASPLDFTALLRDLGVVRKNDKVRFVDQAPLASVRRALLAPR